MNLNRRQVFILSELLARKSYIGYKEICSKANACEKTIRADIRVINSLFKNENIEILFKKNMGFIIDGDPNALDKLNERYNTGIYSNSDIDILMSNSCKIINLILNSNDSLKIETIAENMKVSIRSASSMGKLLKELLKQYKLSLVVKPHYGLSIEGEELGIRYCLADVAFSNTDLNQGQYLGENILAFGVSMEEITFISKKVTEFIREEKLIVSMIELRKNINRIVFSYLRSRKGNYVSYTDEQKQYLDSYFSKKSTSRIIDELRDYFGLKNNEEERYYFKQIFLTSIDYCIPENSIYLSSEFHIKAITLAATLSRKLSSLGIITRQMESRFTQCFYSITSKAVLYQFFGIVETSLNSVIKEIACGTPLCAAIGSFLYADLQKLMNYPLGNYFRLNLIMEIYTLIQEIENREKRLNLAVFSPTESDYGESLARNIKEDYYDFIEKVDQINALDLYDSDLSGYDCVICYGGKKPHGLPKDLKTIQVNFYYRDWDSRNIYRYVIIPSLKHENAFGSIDKKCYISKCTEITNAEGIKKYVRNLLKKDTELLEQFNEYEFNTTQVVKETLNIILFTKEKKNTLCRMIELNEKIIYYSTVISQVFINVVCIDSNPIALKTTEKVIRNVTILGNEKQILFGENPLDFYKLYTSGEDVVLK